MPSQSIVQFREVPLTAPSASSRAGAARQAKQPAGGDTGGRAAAVHRGRGPGQDPQRGRDRRARVHLHTCRVRLRGSSYLHVGPIFGFFKHHARGSRLANFGF